MAVDHFPPDVAGLTADRVPDARELAGQVAVLLCQSAGAVSQIRVRLDSLARYIAARSAEREQSGRFEEIISQAPWLTARAQELQVQQVQLTETLEAIRRSCEIEGGPHTTWLELQRRFEAFLDLWLEHEAAECELLREVYPEPEWT
jgi:hypothetical protein